MIIRKPYAFLIKYFKIIHILLFFMMTYLLFKTRNVHTFFADYLKSNVYTLYDNMAFRYISVFAFFIVIVLITFVFLIYFLMKEKKKNRLYYLLAIIFYILSLIYFIVIVNFFSSLEFQSYSKQIIVLYRDISLVMYLGHYFFLAVAFARGFGFDIKKFNFEKDLIDLDISAEDREEVELGKTLDYETVANYARRGKRNISYFFKENSFIINTFIIVLVLVLSTSFIINNFIVNRVYKENTKITMNGYSFVVNSSYITNKDKYGKENKEGIYYLVVDFNVYTESETPFKLNTSHRVKVGKEYYYISKDITSKINDFGTVYKNQNIVKDKDNHYLYVFEIPKKISSAVFELYSSQTVNGGVMNVKYKKIKLNPYKFKEKNIGDYKVNNDVPLKNTYLKKGSLNIKNFEILDLENYTYTVCKIEDNCEEKKKALVPSGVNKFLKIEYEQNDVSNNLFTYLNIRNKNDKNILVTAKNIKNVTPDNYYQNTILFEVSNKVKDINSIELYFNIRDASFSITK